MNTISTFDRFRDQVVGHRPCVYFEVNAQDERHFLTFAADMGCMWANGTAIDPSTQDHNVIVFTHNNYPLSN